VKVFETRHALAERAAARYERSLQAVPASSLSYVRLSDGLAAVLAELDRAGRLVGHGERAALSGYSGCSRRDPSRRLSRKQRLTPAERHLHNLHRSLIRLERAADAAAALAIAHALPAPPADEATAPADDAVEVALTALAAALRELQRV
jgi:hypothetical protein